VIDVTYIKLIGGDAGLGKFWNKWRKCIARIIEVGHRPIFEHFFVGEMRNAPLMAAYVLEYDEADVGTGKHTWEWLLEKGRASFQRERERDNHLQSLSALKDMPRAISDARGLGTCGTSLRGQHSRWKGQTGVDKTEG
jgi:hypothetical protein